MVLGCPPMAWRSQEVLWESVSWFKCEMTGSPILTALKPQIPNLLLFSKENRLSDTRDQFNWWCVGICNSTSTHPQHYRPVHLSALPMAKLWVASLPEIAVQWGGNTSPSYHLTENEVPLVLKGQTLPSGEVSCKWWNTAILKYDLCTNYWLPVITKECSIHMK